MRQAHGLGRLTVRTPTPATIRLSTTMAGAGSRTARATSSLKKRGAHRGETPSDPGAAAGAGRCAFSLVDMLRDGRCSISMRSADDAHVLAGWPGARRGREMLIGRRLSRVQEVQRCSRSTQAVRRTSRSDPAGARETSI
jgi:hypothetical protein